MTAFDIDELASWSGGEWLNRPDAPVTGFCFDSRTIAGGDMFVALSSARADGHDYVASALGGGASAALVRRGFAEAARGGALEGAPLLAVDDPLAAFQKIALGWRRKVAPFIVGVTGSVGKSTVKEWTAAILSDWRSTAATKANFNNDIGLPASLLKIEGGTDFGVFEAGVSHPGDMAPLAATMAPDAAILTTVAPVHIEFFDSLRGIADEKAGLIRAVPAGGFCVLDANGEFFGHLAAQAKCRVVGVAVVQPGAEPPEGAQYVARVIDEAECRFTLAGPGLDGPLEFCLGRPGAHNILNALLAAAAARECGAPWGIVAGRLRALPGVALRWERFSRDGIEWICDAYNANPMSMAASIRAFAMAVPCGTARRAFVLGEMYELGQGEAEYHRGVGEALGRIETCGSDILVCVGPLARHYGTPKFRGRVFHAHDALDAASILHREAGAGAVVLLKASHGLRLDTVPSLYAMPLPELSGEGAAPVVILGAGRSGAAARALLEARGVGTIVLDGDDPFPACRVSLAVASPGIPDSHPWLAECERRRVRVIAELELGYLFWHGRILAVTGSKGKSSVVKLCAGAISATGRAAAPCGNYGTPLSELAMAPEPHGWAIVEASSFQLQRTAHFRPGIAVLLNLQADHLDRHGTMVEYASAKFRLFSRYDGADDAAIVEAGALREALEMGVREAGRLAEEAEETGRSAGPGGIVALGRTDGTAAVEARTGYFANPVLAPAARAASVALASAGVGREGVLAAFECFEPLEHRMRKIAEKGGVVYIDNSKATSLAALAASLEMAGRPARLIAGGRLKEKNLETVKGIVAKFAKKVYLIGEASERLFFAWGDAVPCEKCGGMPEAVAAAARDARAGEAVLLAPGCASFDQYGGCDERGRDFAGCVARTI